MKEEVVVEVVVVFVEAINFGGGFGEKFCGFSSRNGGMIKEMVCDMGREQFR